MRSDSQIASRFEQHELPVWTESQELRRFIAGYLALLPLTKAAAEIDERFVEYVLELSDGVTGRIIEVLRRASFQALVDKSQKVGFVATSMCRCAAGVAHCDGEPKRRSADAVRHRPKAVILPLGHP
jgi:hypothetical protein